MTIEEQPVFIEAGRTEYPDDVLECEDGTQMYHGQSINIDSEPGWAIVSISLADGKVGVFIPLTPDHARSMALGLLDAAAKAGGTKQ